MGAHARRAAAPAGKLCRSHAPAPRALAKSPADRYPTCGAFLEDVRSRLPSQEIETAGRPSARVLTLAGPSCWGDRRRSRRNSAFAGSTGPSCGRRHHRTRSLLSIPRRDATGIADSVGGTPSRCSQRKLGAGFSAAARAHAGRRANRDRYVARSASAQPRLISQR
jgi:hypothetical protein